MPRPACYHQNHPTEEAWVNVRPLSGLRTVALILPAQGISATLAGHPGSPVARVEHRGLKLREAGKVIRRSPQCGTRPGWLKRI